MDHPLLDASSTNVINFLSIWLSLRVGGVYYIHFCYKDKHIQGFILRLLEQQRGFVIEMVESSHNSKCNVQFQKFWVWSSYLVILVIDRIPFLDIWLLRGKVSSLSFISNIPFFVRISCLYDHHRYDHRLIIIKSSVNHHYLIHIWSSTDPHLMGWSILVTRSPLLVIRLLSYHRLIIIRSSVKHHLLIRMT